VESNLVKNIAEKIANLVYKQGCVNITGNYNLSQKNFETAIIALLENNLNVLSEHMKITHSIWEAKEDSYNTLYSEEDIIFLEKALETKTFWNIYSFANSAEIENVKSLINRSKNFYDDLRSYNFRKKQAKSFLANKKNREIIFEKYGKICKICNESQNLSIDHIIPVAKGGTDTLDNFQILCVRCNSKKGCKC
jgi:5-methylcytosine-specific restriction endonuclease McrA